MGVVFGKMASRFLLDNVILTRGGRRVHGARLIRAEGEGVEPSVALQLRRFSKPMH